MIPPSICGIVAYEEKGDGAMLTAKLKNRDLYLNRMIAFQDTGMIKVMTGIRRCGKSSLMKRTCC